MVEIELALHLVHGVPRNTAKKIQHEAALSIAASIGISYQH